MTPIGRLKKSMETCRALASEWARFARDRAALRARRVNLDRRTTPARIEMQEAFENCGLDAAHEDAEVMLMHAQLREFLEAVEEEFVKS